MKRYFKYLFVPIIIALIFCIPLYGTSFYLGNDTLFHISRIVGLSQGLRSHTFPVYIYPYTNNGFGYGSPMFYCDLFLLIPAILYTIGVPIVIVYKLIIAFFAFIAACTSYYLFKYIFKDNKIGLFCTVLYCFTNVLPLYFYTSSGVGTMMALSFLPILMLSLYKFFIEKNNCWLLLGISFTLILLTHILTFALCVVIFGLFLIIDYKQFNKNRLICLLKAIGISLGLSAFFLFPMLEQLLSQEFWLSFLDTNQNKGWLSGSQVTLSVILNDYIFKGTTLSKFYLGILLYVYSIISYILLKIHIRKISHIDILFVLVIILTLPQIKGFPATSLKALVSLQFTWRVNVLLLPFTIYLIGNYLKLQNKKILNIVIIITCIYLGINGYMYYDCLNKDQDSVFIYNNETYEEIIGQGTNASNLNNRFNYYEVGQGEYLPLTNNYDYISASTNIIYANDDDAIFDFNRVGTTIIFNTNLSYDEKLYMPLSWYKGYYYQELDDKDNVLLEGKCGYSEYTKRVEVSVKEGMHTYKVYYKGTAIQKISLLVSIVCFVLLIIYTIKNTRNFKMFD